MCSCVPHFNPFHVDLRNLLIASRVILLRVLAAFSLAYLAAAKVYALVVVSVLSVAFLS